MLTLLGWHWSEGQRHLSSIQDLFPGCCCRVLVHVLSRTAAAAGGHATHHASGLLVAARAHLDRLEAQRRLYLSARALGLAQRTLLYAHDELSMAVMRIRCRLEGEQVSSADCSIAISILELMQCFSRRYAAVMFSFRWRCHTQH